ncbi:c-type cytochrome [Lutibacter sp.]|uniref:c-type cytochrome n=1 Tax=Lutibacter sp. TaxID=1925666 RepID=UPI001A2874E3|nr:c-type cytochrome [Lutibacter sp.]MBI9040057.1 c-type cytochrome [Lutibacter sp.]
MKLKVFVLAGMVALVASCGSDGKKDDKSAQPQEEVKEAVEVDPMKDKGIGPVKSITLGEIDQAMADQGHELFKAKCSACHKEDKRFVGPALAGVTERRTPEWIMNMILNPEVMVAENPIAKQLLAEYLSPMANQSLTEQEARFVLEYFRTLKVAE